MDYIEAVRLARDGKKQGFDYLYENTYKSKYYLALQYMKNRDAAEDVLQDAYVKAFSKLDMLEKPENFSAWLGQIVANTAKNALAKNNPLLFTDVAAETEIEEFADMIEDEDIAGKPELSYTREETRVMVRELIDALSEEQRMCILMFHIEGVSIKEIAQTLGCSENTVKSRLNYGRKNLKIKAEELQKKGYKLYSTAPLPLLLLLFNADQSAVLAEGGMQAVGSRIAEYVYARIPGLQSATEGVQAAGSAQAVQEQPGAQAAQGQAGAQSGTQVSGTSGAGNTGTGGAAKTAFFHTMAGKITAVVVSLCVVGGIIFGVSQLAGNKDAANDSGQENQARQTQPVTVADEDYPELLEGNLTKEELEFVLAYGPETLTEQGLSDSDCLDILNRLCQASKAAGKFITYAGLDANYRSGYSANDINRYMSSFTDYRFTEDNDSDTPYGIDVSGDTLWYTPAELSFEADASIADASYLDDTMMIHFTSEKKSYENGTSTTEKTATLKKNSDGKFRIITIEEGYIPLEITDSKSEMSAKGNSGKSGNAAELRTVYEDALQSVEKQESGYDFPSAGGSTDFQYFLWDMNGDGIKELVVGAMFTVDVFDAYDIRVFTVTESSSGYTIKPVKGDIVSMATYLPADGKGLYTMDMSRGTGGTDIYRITIKDNTLTCGRSPEISYTMGDDTGTQFINSNSYAEWKSISDTDGLKELK